MGVMVERLELIKTGLKDTYTYDSNMLSPSYTLHFKIQ